MSKEEMRVLALAAEAWGGRGGIAQSTRDLLGALIEMPGIVEVQVLPRLQPEPNPEVPHGIVQHTPSTGRLAYARRALWLAAIKRPDVVYCGHAFMASLAQLVARVAGAKLVVHVHGLEVWQPLRPGVQRGITAADLVFCVSNHTGSKVVDATGSDPSRCVTIYNTVDDRFFPRDRKAARARFKIASDATVLSTVARLDSRQRHKGHDRVIPLLAKLSRDIPNLTYLIAGTGDDRQRLEALAEETGASGLVRFLGFVADAELPDLYNASDLYVMPSHGEGFGIAFVEAMACGTPAIGLDVGGAGDALRNGELGCAVTEEAFPEALRASLLLPPAERAELSKRTRAMFGRGRFFDRLSQAMSSITIHDRFRTRMPSE